MQNKDVLMQLLLIGEREATSIVNAAFIDFAEYIAAIYNDIYDSCIKVYYSTYDPVVYDRHGDPEGFNLYNASDAYASDLRINLSLQSSKLLPYAGRVDKRDRVLDSVLEGLRGGGARTQSFRGWPMPWDAYYPNEFSHYSDWESSSSTLDGILKDFSKNGPSELSYKLYEFIWNNL